MLIMLSQIGHSFSNGFFVLTLSLFFESDKKLFIRHLKDRSLYDWLKMPHVDKLKHITEQQKKTHFLYAKVLVYKKSLKRTLHKSSTLWITTAQNSKMRQNVLFQSTFSFFMEICIPQVNNYVGTFLTGDKVEFRKYLTKHMTSGNLRGISPSNNVKFYVYAALCLCQAPVQRMLENF